METTGDEGDATVFEETGPAQCGKGGHQVTGERPAELPEARPSLTYRPMLSALRVPSSVLFDWKLTFDVIYAARCLEGKGYNVPVENWNGEDVEFDDALCFLLMDKLIKALGSVGLDYFKLLADYLDSGHIVLGTMEMGCPQLKHSDFKHDLKIENAAGAIVHHGTLCTPKGDQFSPISDLDTVHSKSFLRVSFTPRFDVDSHPVCLKGSVKHTLCIKFGEITLESEGGYETTLLCKHPVPSPCTDVDTLLMPQKWFWEEVLKVRRRDGRPKVADTFAEFESGQTDPCNLIDPMQLLLLRCVLANKPERWAEYLKLESNGRFKSEAVGTSRDTDKLILRFCDSLSNLWAEDLCGVQLWALAQRVQLNAAHLVDEPWFAWVLKAMMSGTMPGYTLDSDERAAFDSKGGTTDDVPFDAIKTAAQRCRAWRPSSGEDLLDKGVHQLFVRKVVDKRSQFDDKKQVNFSNGICYDPGKKRVRDIELEDGATLNTRYPFPTMDAAKQDDLDGYLAEIFPNKRICDWNIAQRARCLQMSQADPLVLMSSGRAGGGKNTLCDFTMKAYGPDYAVQCDKALFGQGSKFADPEAPKSQRAQLKNKLYVCAHEPPTIDGDTIKDWTGGSMINARGMRENNKAFPAQFAVLELTFNPRNGGLKIVKDEGTERRLKACKYENGYVFCKSEEEARQRQEELKSKGVYPITTAKKEKMFALAPQLMARFIKIHKEGLWPEEPPEVAEWTTKLWAENNDTNPLQEPMNTWYKRCNCMPSQNGALVDDQEKPCTHHIKGSDLMHKLKNEQLYKAIKGPGRSDARIYDMLAKVKMGDPPISLCKKMVQNSPVIFGLLEQPSPEE